MNPTAFHEFEHRGWEEVGNRYDGSWAVLTTQSIEALLDAASVGRGVTVLDVACGPGYAAGAAASRGSIAIGIDFSAVMVDQARRRYPDVEFREGDAEALPFPDGGFDVVVSNFGLLHLAQPERALAEAHRVLKSGGRLAFTVWATPDKAAAHGIVLKTIQEFGDINAPIPAGPPFFRFSEAAESTRVLSLLGFTKVRVTEVEQFWRLPSPDALFDIMLNSSVRNAAILRAQKPSALSAIREAMTREVETYGGVLPMPSVLTSAERAT
jgi:SAM-dependent methyltransferase